MKLLAELNAHRAVLNSYMTMFLAGWLGLVMERYSETFTAAQLGAKKAKNVIHLAFAWPAAGTHIEKEIRNCKKDIRADVSNKGASALATKKASDHTEAAALKEVREVREQADT